MLRQKNNLINRALFNRALFLKRSSISIVKRALSQNAAAVVLAHNHPSGVTDPSRADKELTYQMKKALELIDVRLLDHIIVGEGPCASFAEMGWL